ncbi:MAG: arsenate reductase [Gemmatimonadetes bacterium]|nr:arsenate reductase [Gemmatimonadota bacterium]
MPIQIFGTKKSAETRRAQRFFSERRIPVQFVDLKVKAASPGELRRFAQKFGVRALIDRDGRRFADLGLRHAAWSDDRWLQKLVEEPLLLKLPLVRNRQRLTVGVEEAEWKRWVQDVSRDHEPSRARR